MSPRLGGIIDFAIADGLSASNVCEFDTKELV